MWPRLTHTAKLDVDVLETDDYEYGVDDIVLVENDGASGFAGIERVYDVRTVVLAASNGFDGAAPVLDLDVGVGGGVREGEKCEGSKTHGWAGGAGMCYMIYILSLILRDQKMVVLIRGWDLAGTVHLGRCRGEDTPTDAT